MNLPFTVFGCCLLILTCTACGEDDTILALNVDSKAEVGSVEELAVTVTQKGKTPFRYTFVPPMKQAEAGTVIDEDFFERITLPSSFDTGPIKVTVSATNGAGRMFMDDYELYLRAGETAAAFIELAPPPAPPPSTTADAGTDGGTADAGADGATGDAGRDGAMQGS